ncbi:hypothetical protein K4K49_001218 [Colletotrichum sp. SAR 10_70]|nr:hypothetical protein K4K50_006153 [Colletotrichum sp. SAR 10_71]KAI8181262.1 hypothetical protein K4K49_001218 [Colletotrichum sp. SAR 10_70]KAI8210530.1 hypothetical protein K4K52_012061 [Colletotrichum sp. SAR 10_76]
MDFQPPRETAWFDVGQTLELFPHLNLAEPWGGAYPVPKWSEMKNIAAYPRGFDPDAEVDKAVICKVKIISHLRVGLGRGPQVLLCKATQYPQTLAQSQMPFPPSDAKEHLADHFVLKVSDGGLFPGGGGIPPWNNWELADQDHSRDSSALRYLYQKHLERGVIMGYPYHVPSYFGTWVVKLPYENKAGEQKMRYVGAVAMEFIRGVSIDDLCKGVLIKNRNINLKSDDDENESFFHAACLVPRNDPGLFRGPEFAGLVIDAEDEAFRLTVLKGVLDGVVKTLHAGVQYNDPSPQNTFVTIVDDSNSEAAVPRIVFLDYFSFEIYEKTKYAKDPEWPDVHPLAEEPRPVHPFERCCIIPLSKFSGWYPPLWDKHPLLFDCWLGKMFGKVEEGSYSIFSDRGDESGRSLRKLVADHGANYTDTPIDSKDDFLHSVKDHTGVDVSEFMNRKAYQDLAYKKEEAVQSAKSVLGKNRRRDDGDDEEGGEVLLSMSKRQRQ